MNFIELLDREDSIGKSVAFNKGIDRSECYFDARMKAKIVNIEYADGNCIKIVFGIEQYEKHNDSIEKNNYYDSGGMAILSSKQAGMYPVLHKETVWFDETDDVAKYFDFIEDTKRSFIIVFRVDSSVGCWHDPEVCKFDTLDDVELFINTKKKENDWFEVIYSGEEVI